MTVVMRAMAQAPGTKVLRIAFVSGGRIVEERLMRRRTTVTVGTSAKATFVVNAANFPAQFKLFERAGDGYVLNFLDGMSGRIALPTGMADLESLKTEALRIGVAYQVKIPDDVRGKIVIGDATFLFQFVAAPLVEDRSHLAHSLTRGLGSQIDWNLTVLAAISFMLHFGTVAVSSRWEAEVTEVGTVGLIEMDRASSIPYAEVAVDEKREQPPVDAKPGDPQSPTKAASPKGAPQKPSHEPAPAAPITDVKEVSALVKQADEILKRTIGVLGRDPSTEDVLKNGNAPPIDMSPIAEQPNAVGTTKNNGLNVGKGTGPVVPAPSFLPDVPTSPPVPSTAGTVRRPPIPVVRPDVPITTLPPDNAAAAILANQARVCYQRVLGSNPAAAGQGRLSVTMRVGPSGEVSGASISSNSGVGAQVANCISAFAGRLQFKTAGPAGGSVVMSFNFVQQDAK